ncbi:hypothetical protein WD019_10650 [Fictibacillus sp. Mic-4]|uniref:hypothetical protein n=1 Tax=Fictibacillus sp. Mic-4 TaxID=3132826 RepID=UPI003CFB0FEC
MRQFVIYFVVLLFALTGCEKKINPMDPVKDDVNLKNKKLAVIYTDVNSRDSELVLINNKDKIEETQRFKYAGIVQVIKNPSGGLLLPVQLEDILIQIASNGEVNEQKIKTFPLFMETQKGYRLTTYNTAMDYGTIEILENGKKKSKKLDGLLRSATADQKYVYVYGNVNGSANVLYVLDRQNLKLIKDMTLSYGPSDCIKVIDGKVFLSSDNDNMLTIVTPDSWKVSYMKLPYTGPDRILSDSDSIYIAYELGNRITKIDRKTLEIQKSFKLSGQNTINMRMDNKYLYILSQTDLDEQPIKGAVGRIGIYDKQTGKMSDEIILPEKRDMLVQDLELLD